MTDPIILPAGSALRSRFEALAAHQRMVFIAGLPGVGKSLLVRQLALLAHRAGRRIHLLQWDAARSAFETPAILARYPEVDGFTHLAIKKAVGQWARGHLLRWHESNADPANLLIAEAVFIGNRLSELIEPAPDQAESLLASELLRFVLPVPTREVRQLIEASRDRTMEAPRHPREKVDARPNVLRALWDEVYREGTGQPPGQGPAPYDPEIYTAVFRRWLAARHVEVIPIDQPLDGSTSAYDFGVPVEDLAATPLEVARTMTAIDEMFGPNVPR